MSTVTAAPWCFLHVPKCAGSSVHASLEAALSADAIAPKRFDRSVFCDFDDFDALAPSMRALIAADAEEVAALQRYPVVSGHFSLPTLRSLAPPERIITMVREPRARLLSLYAYWRSADFSAWSPYVAHRHAYRPLDEFLSEPSIAAATDNQLCRLVLHGDPLIPRVGFIAEADLPEVAQRTLGRLDQLAFVGIQEMTGQAWGGLSRALGVPLSRQRVNVTEAPLAQPVARWRRPRRRVVTPAAAELLDRRTVASRLVYAGLAMRAGMSADGAEQLAGAAYAAQVTRTEHLGSDWRPASWRGPSRRRRGSAQQAS